MSRAIDDLIRESLRKQTLAIEEMCERMLVTPGKFGVLVESWPNGSWKVSLSPDETPMEITYRSRQDPQ